MSEIADQVLAQTNADRAKRRLATAWGAALAGLAWCVALPTMASGAYPSKPVTLIVPYTAGGSTDVVARVIAQKLTERLGQTFIVENKPGANAVIGMDAAARAAPDGYTLLLNTAGGQALTPVLYKTKFHALDSWEPISLISTIPLVVVVHEGKAKDWADLVKQAQAGTPPLSASSGSSLVTLMTDALKQEIKAPTLMNIQYKGTAMQAQAVVKGEVDFSIDSFVTKPHFQSGRVKPLAVISDKRVDSLPNVPTLKEAGTNLSAAGWNTFFANKSMPAAQVKRYADAIQKVMQDPEVLKQFKTNHLDPVVSSDVQTAERLAAYKKQWAPVIKASGYKP